MPTLKITNRAGVEASVATQAGRTLMDLLRERREVEAMCGGEAVCATCHVHIAEEWIAVVGEASGFEADLLDSSIERLPNSRLSCQVVIADEMDGLALRVAPAEG